MRFAFFGSLRIRLVLLAALAILPSMLMVSWMTLEEYQDTKETIGEDAMRLVHIAVAQHDHMLRDARLFLALLAHSREAVSGDVCAITGLMAQNEGLLHTYNMGVAAPDGRLLASLVTPKTPINFADLQSFRRALLKKDPTTGSCVANGISGNPIIVLFHPVLDVAGRVRLLLFAGIRLAWLNEFALLVGLPKGASLTVWDSNYRVLAREPDPARWVGKTFAVSDRFKSLIHRSEGLVTLNGIDGDSRLYAFARLDEGPGGKIFVSIGIPSRLPEAELKRLLLYLCLLTSLALVAFPAAWMFGEIFILRHLERLLGCAKRIAAGDLAARIGMPRPTGELGELICAFDSMGEALEQRVRERGAAQTALKESENLYRAVFETTGTAMLLTKKDKTVSIVNQQFERLLGFSAEEVQGKMRWTEFVINEDLPRMEQYHRLRRVDPDAAPRQYEARLLAKNGTVRDLLLTVGLIPGTESTVASLIDIAARNNDRRTLEKTQEELRALAAKNLTLQETGREQLARELHDRVGQNLSGLAIDLAIIREQVRAQCREKIAARLLDAKELVNDTMQCIRNIISELHPPGLSEYGLSAALVVYCEKLAVRTDMKIYTDCRQIPIRPSKEAEIALFRIAQEALCNSVNHSRAGSIRLEVQMIGSKIVIRVSDDGLGFDPDSEITSGGKDRFGLACMRERAAAIGARFRIVSGPGEGAVVSVEFEV